MGIDIYARWLGQGPSEIERQFDAWLSYDGGRIGYLREAYHGEPYATRYLVPEAFEKPKGVQIAAKVLQERLPQIIPTASSIDRNPRPDCPQRGSPTRCRTVGLYRLAPAVKPEGRLPQRPGSARSRLLLRIVQRAFPE